jgi:hypothetical protein
LVDTNDTRKPCLARKGVELASEIRHAADASGCACIRPPSARATQPRLPLLVTFRTLA